MPRPIKHVFICGQMRPPGHPRGSCQEKGAQAIQMEFSMLFEEKGLWGKYAVTNAGCLGLCDQGPTVLVYPDGVMYAKVSKADVAAIIDEHLLGGTPVERLLAPPELW